MSKRSKIITIIIILAFTVYAGVSLYNLWGLQYEVTRTRDEAEKEVAELQQKIAELEYRLENLEDPDVMRRIAEDMGWVSPDALVITDSSSIELTE